MKRIKPQHFLILLLVATLAAAPFLIRGLIDRSAQLVEGRIGRIFFDEPKDERFIAKPTNGIRIVTANLSIKFLQSHADVTSLPS